MQCFEMCAATAVNTLFVQQGSRKESKGGRREEDFCVLCSYRLCLLAKAQCTKETTSVQLWLNRL